MTLPRYAKAIWAFLSTIVGALIIAVTTTPAHSLRDVGTLGWLTVAATVLGVTGGVYGWSNTAPPARRMLATGLSLEATYTQTLAAVNTKLDRILAAVTGTTTPPVSPPAPPTPPPTPTPTPTPTPVPTPPPAPPAPAQVVAWINQSQSDLSTTDAAKIVAALNVQAADLVRHWPGLAPVTHVLCAADAVPTGAWKAYWLPNSDVAGALGFHDVDPHGDPYQRTFTRYNGTPWPSLVPGADGISISNISSHEAVEMAVDPSCTLVDKAPDGKEWARESADPVEAYAYDVTLPDGSVVSLSDYVTAAFFQEGSAGPWDATGQLTAPFTIAPGGYQIEDGKQVFADHPSLRFLSQQGSPAGRTARRLAAH